MTTNIEWADVTWNPVVGCTPVSPGCLNCYAATMARRLQGMGKPGYEPRPCGTFTVEEARAEPNLITRIAEVRNGRAVFTGDVRLLEDRLTEPLGWRKPRRIFVCSMSDLFHEAVPFDYIDRVFAVAALCPQHQFLVLTKRPERMAEWFDSARRRRIEDAAMDMLRDYDRAGCIDRAAWPLPNVWLGTSCEDQARADERIPHLLRCPAAVRWLSCEPLLGPIDLCNERRDWLRPLRSMFKDRPPIQPGIDWCIVGGESGAHARPCNVEWIRSIVRQCSAASVPCFVKQLGSRVVARNDQVSEWLDECGIAVTDVDTDGVRMQGDPVRVRLRDRKGGDPDEWPEDLRVREWPEVTR